MTENKFNTYDFLINEYDEVMLLIYDRDSIVEKPQITIDVTSSSAILRRNDNDGITINDISEDILDVIQDQETLLVCELSATENDDDTKITNAYEAKINIV